MITTQTRKKLLWLGLAAISGPTLALAHDLRLSTIDILDQTARAELTVRTPLSHLARLEHAPGQAMSAIEADMAVRRRLHLQADGRTIMPGPSTISIDAAADLITWQTLAPAPAANLSVQDPLFPEETEARLRVRTTGASGRIQDRWVVAEGGGTPPPSTEHGVWATIWRFVRMGAGHIFDGPDHIAFIVGLVLLGGSLRSLLLTVTAFTLAHSITLALAALGVWSPSPRVIEPLIALSIVAIAAENLWRRGSVHRRPYYAFVFGLVHGFGLAGPLHDLGVGTLSLAPFNIGVELAQGAIVLAVWPILLWLSRRHPAAMVRTAALGSIGIGILGTFWFVDRLSPAVFAQSGESADTVAARVNASFQPYAPLVSARHDAQLFYVESDGIPDHRMMVGITAWQQQVPLPQSYRGDNAWRFPLFPRVASAPLSAKEHFFRGAIAIAANGVPIFNPIKNDGITDTFLAGELDEFGGHCGRADDYHYHLAPLHLQKVLGTATPVAYALDGYSIYGLTEADGSAPATLDTFNGHIGKDGSYHYHATKAYPYLNGGFHGEVVERDGQVDPQPHADPVRPASVPLRGATITGFEKLAGNSYTLTYSIRGETRKVHYTVQADGNYIFDFIDGRGAARTETYTRRGRGRGRGGPPR